MIALNIPTIIERIAEADRRPLYAVRPVFFDGFEKRAEREDLATERCATALRGAVMEAGKSADHRLLADWSFAPELARHHLRLHLRLRKRTFEGRFLFVVFEEFGRRIAHCVKMPELDFAVRRGESVDARAEEVLTAYFRRMEKEEGGPRPEDAATPGFARLSEIRVESQPQQTLPKERSIWNFAGIASDETMDGAAELERVGRCLDRLYPQRLGTAILREEEVGRLLALFSRPKPERRPVVLVGPSLTGKTAVVHEFVRRRIRETNAPKREGKLWLLAPQRLLAGMSFVGQWEGRLLAVLHEARRRGHILYFDDLLGMFQAGRSRESDLTMGHLLKAQLEDKAPQILAEATPEQWRRLREADRGFADMFQVVPVREPGDEDTVRVLVRVMQEIERDRRCEFAPAVLPFVMRLQRRFARTRAFPGKGAEQLRQLASARPQGATITAEDVLEHFQATTGIARLFLDRSRTVDRRDVETFFEKRIAGQAAAVTAMTDAVSLARAGLTDGARPLASLLFLGPTGVGKTECAKALAEYVFGTEERLLRLDMNEFTGPDAVERLIGGSARPRGQLTDAIIRQPYGVLLLDEVEKAHPDAFDLLLQVLGDGRLTDAGGRTADFANALVILTSNLGARDARQSLGFATEQRDNSATYVGAAESFFRPELFNRLDRVVPFHELTRDHIAALAKGMAERALERHGFRQRRMAVEVDPAVYGRIVEHGFDREFGARALRRAVEEELVQPLAGQLALAGAEGLESVRVVMDDGRPVLRSQGYREAERHWPVLRPLTPREATDLLAAGNDFLLRIEGRLARIEETTGATDFAGRAFYYALREDTAAIRTLRDRIKAAIDLALDPRRKPTPPTREGRHATRMRVPARWSGHLLAELNRASDVGAFLTGLQAEAEIVGWLPFAAENFAQRCASLDFILEGAADQPECASLDIAPMTGARPGPDEITRYRHFLESYAQTFPEGTLDNQTLTVEGLRISVLLALEHGTHLFCGAGGQRQFCVVGGDPEAAIIRVHHEQGMLLDLRTGILVPNAPRRALWDCINPLLPPVPELSEFYREEGEP